MRSAIGELERIIDRFQDTKILVVGDLLVDHYIWGTVNRVSPEAPVVVVNVTREDRRLGGAGNVVRNIVALGGRATICAVVGDDDAGRAVSQMLKDQKVDPGGLAIDPSRPTIVKTRVIAHSQQVVRIDHESVFALDTTLAADRARLIAECLPEMNGIVVSDYGKGTVGEQILEPLLHRAANLPMLVDPKAPHFHLYRGATVVKPNRFEASQASGVVVSDRTTAAKAGRILLKDWKCEMVLITLGEEGMVLVNNPNPKVPAIEVDTVAQEVFDVSGAGDTVSAVFTLSLAVGASPEDAAVLANCAAGVVVGEVGTVTVSSDELKEHLRRWESGG